MESGNHSAQGRDTSLKEEVKKAAQSHVQMSPQPMGAKKLDMKQAQVLQGLFVQKNVDVEVPP
jgi:hypothetical protein